MDIRIQELPFDPAALRGRSEKLLCSHHQNNCTGAVMRLSAIRAQLYEHLPADRDVVVCCVHGHEVGRATALRLRAADIRARYLRGGIDAWKSAGQQLQCKGGTS